MVPKDKSPKNSESEENIDLEKSLAQLEAMVEQLEGGNIGLDEAFKIFEEGSALSEKINKKINSYERKLQILNEHYKLQDLDEDRLIGNQNEE